MTLPTLKQTLTDYRSRHIALPAFNIDCFATYQAVEAVISQTNLPCIVQLSAGQDQFIQAERLLMLVKKAQIDGLPIYTNIDHGQNISRLEQLVSLGFDMVHFDGSHFGHQENLSISQLLVQKIRQVSPHALIEVEFNQINSVQKGTDSSRFTDPKQAKEFIQKTKADLLAVSVGNLHGVDVKHPENINTDLLVQIQKSVPHTFLVMHGGSGIDPNQLNTAIASGIVKININTDLRLVFRQSLKDSLASTNSLKAYQYFKPAIEDISQIITKKLSSFSSQAP
ncbi:hypothetical protein CL634_07495 [bacterium]|nr:hypothetical protein [bacterium]